MKNPIEWKKDIENRREFHTMSPLKKAEKGIKIYTPGFGSEKRFKVDDLHSVGKAYSQGDVPQHVAHQIKYTSDSLIKNKPILENKLYDDYKEYIPQLTKFMVENGMKIIPFPKIKIVSNAIENSKSIFGKTAYYDKKNKCITLFTLNRHPKDILRSFAHEMVHHEQNLNGELDNIITTNTNEDGHMEQLERDAYEKGNIMLRNWEDKIKNNKLILHEDNNFNIGDTIKVDGKWFTDNKEHIGKIIYISPDGSRIKVKCNTYPFLFSISTKNVKLLENKSKTQNEYGCLMLKINFPNWNKFINNYIDKNDVYDNELNEFGLEYEPHITILYGFHNNTNVEKIKKIIQLLKNKIIITLDSIDIFTNDKYDVVKFKVKSPTLIKLNKIMKNNFNYTSNFPNYNPHMTIGYVKSGLGEKYIKDLDKKLSFTSNSFIYSYPDSKKEEFNN